jgi:hypothetical protein
MFLFFKKGLQIRKENEEKKEGRGLFHETEANLRKASEKRNNNTTHIKQEYEEKVKQSKTESRPGRKT